MNNTKKTILRKIWTRYFCFDWKLGIFLIIVFAILRFIFALSNAKYGGSSVIFFLFFSCWFIPVILLTSEGQKAIGIRKPDKWIKLLYAFVAGIVFCAISYLISYLLYGNSIYNSFVYLARVYSLTPEMLEASRYKLFYFSLLVGMTFSPIGEEFLYRGVIHGCFVDKYGENKASIIDSLVFMVVHLPHFGIIYNLGQWSFPLFPALLWMFFMYTLARMFFIFKTYSNSIWAPVFAHAGYNGMLMYFTYFHIL